MNKGRMIIIISSFLAAFGSFNAAAESQETQKNNGLYQGRIIIGMEVWPGYFPLIVARDKGYFKEEGLDVEIKQYVSLGSLSKDYTAGKMQGRANLTLDGIKEALDGLQHRIVLAIDYSNGSDAIIARKEIKTVTDFRGKRVGYEPGTLEEFFIVWALRENDMEISDIIPIFANPEETVKKLKKGDIDVAVSHEPFLSQFISSGDFHTVYSSKNSPGLITDVLTFREDFIQRNPSTVGAILRAYFRGLNFWKKYPAEANAIAAREFGTTEESMAVQLQGLRMLDERDNQIAFTFAAGFRSLYGNMRQIAKFVLMHQKKNTLQFNTDTLIERRFIKSIWEDMAA